MSGKTVVVTGASAGIGAAAARQLHEWGAKVIPVGRSAQKTAAVAREVGAEPLLADFAELDQVRGLAQELASMGPIDVLLNNAGGVWREVRTTKDGYERTFQVNHLAPYLLTRLLAPVLQASKARVVTTSSAAHKQGSIDLKRLDGTAGMAGYSASKLANILFTAELQRRWGPTGATATSAHPGVVGSEFGRDTRIVKWFYRLGKPLMVSPEKGADTLVWLASAPESDGWEPGGYYAKRKPATMSAACQNMELARELWIRSAEMVGLPEDDAVPG